jgi:cytochrome c biogenesis protein ResB
VNGYGSVEFIREALIGDYHKPKKDTVQEIHPQPTRLSVNHPFPAQVITTFLQTHKTNLMIASTSATLKSGCDRCP